MEPSLTELRLRNTEAKLARLLAAVEDFVATYRPQGGYELRAAIEEARKP